ncbi:MAG TPA: hypothetical protein VKH63_07870 [Candidatus Acidoferrum sp.]|jgi:hypothetical protein|nr:hypothetical protein [Candidatus Acidoferrum sp.]
MFRIKGLLGPLVLAAAMIAPVLASGCAAHTRYYDEYRADYHTWNNGEIGAYRVWIGERHYEYRDYNRLSREQQREYWNWRHNHPGKY